MKEQIGVQKIGTIFFLVLFFLIALWLVIIPSVKHSGHIPSLNKKINALFENPEKYKVEISSLYFWKYTKPSKQLPILVDYSIIYVLDNIMKQETKNDGFVNRNEPEIIVISFFTDTKEFLTCTCSWDKEKKVMELRFDDKFGNMKNSYYSIKDELASELFEFPYR